MSRRGLLWLLAVGLGLAGLCCGAPKLRRFPDRAVLWSDDDRRPLKRMPSVRRTGRWAQLLRAQVTDPLERLLAAPLPRPAKNVNAMGEVPDSSWFQNRNHRRLRSAAAVKRGAARTGGPSLLSPWTVRWAAPTAQGLRVAIKDEDGQRFTLSFDAPGHPRLATSAELVATLLLHALGYHVPERHLVLVDKNQLRVTGGSRLRRPDGKRVVGPLRPSTLKALLSGLPRLSDGSLRALAERADGSTDLGPFRFFGRRADDANDYVDHQRRRELRGLHLVAAWLNLTQISHGVGRDVFLGGNRRYVEHRLAVLRAALGSDPAGRPKPLADGFHPALAPLSALGRALTLGIATPPWRALAPRRRHLLKRWPGLGWLPAERFDAERFRPRMNNAAFAAADDGDRFWAARLVASISRAQLKAVVAEALLPKPEAKRLLKALVLRRKAVLRLGLRARAPLQGYRVLGAMGRLCFTDLWRREGFDGDRLVTYELRLRSDKGALSQHRHLSRSTLVCVALPRVRRRGQDDGYRVLAVRRPDISPSWARVHLRPAKGVPRIVGVER